MLGPHKNLHVNKRKKKRHFNLYVGHIIVIMPPWDGLLQCCVWQPRSTMLLSTCYRPQEIDFPRVNFSLSLYSYLALFHTKVCTLCHHYCLFNKTHIVTILMSFAFPKGHYLLSSSSPANIMYTGEMKFCVNYTHCLPFAYSSYTQ